MSCYFDLGLPLQPILNDAKAFETEAEFYGRQLSIKPINSIKSAIMMLTGELHTIDEKQYLAQALEENDVLIYQMFWARELCAYVYLSDWCNCKRIFDLFEKEKKISTTKFCTGFIHFDFLRGVTAYYLAKTEKKMWYKLRARQFLKKFEGYVKNQMGNAQHQYKLLKAIDLWVHSRQGSEDRIKAAFDEAIRMAARGGYTHHAALANEWAAMFCDEYGERYWGKCYREEAYSRYTDWGATEKTIQLEAQISRAFQDDGAPQGRRRSASGRFGRERYKNMMKQHCKSAFNSKFFTTEKQRAAAERPSEVKMESAPFSQDGK